MKFQREQLEPTIPSVLEEVWGKAGLLLEDFDLG